MNAERRNQRDKLRFWKRVAVLGPDDCWNWTGALFTSGYGVFTVREMATRAHRFSWELHNGEIPDGMVVCHSCDNKKCVNPAHLWLGTNKDNSEDMVAKGRSRAAAGDEHWARRAPEKVARGSRSGRLSKPESYPVGEQISWAKLTASDVVQIRLALKAGIPISSIASDYGVSGSAIRNIQVGRSWKHVA